MVDPNGNPARPSPVHRKRPDVIKLGVQVNSDETTMALRKAAAERRLAVIDNLHPHVRELIHVYGWEKVKLIMDLGVTKAARIAHIIRTIRDEG